MAVLSRRSVAADTRRNNRDALLAASVGLLEAGTPFAEITIDQIVKAAGLSRPTFYTYFQDKRALVLELGQGLLDDVAVAADPWLQGHEGDVRDTLAAVLDVFRSHRGTLAALTEASTYDPEVNDFWKAFHQRFQKTATTRIRSGDPKLPDARVDARAFALVWMTERTLTELIAGAPVDQAALLDELALLWRVAETTPR